MQTAIDRLYVGTEKEVNIKDYDGYKRDDRFVCPECGEYVFAKSGKRACFSHFRKTYQDIDCDRRTDGQVKYTFYERVGLPIYIKRENNYFALYAGFYALGKNLLEGAKKQKLAITISSDRARPTVIQKFLIDYTFFEDQITFKQLTFIPPNGQNYKFSISQLEISKCIYKKWSDYSDGFSKYGALFTYSETSGKKIRRNDTITVGQPYYWMIPKGYYPQQDGIISEFDSQISFKNKVFEIYKIIIQRKDGDSFSTLANFFWKNLKLQLLYSKPEIIPIWPPVIQSNGISYALQPNPKKANLFCRVQSDSKNPLLYRYTDEKYRIIETNTEVNNIKSINLALSEAVQVFTIDRRYLANAIMICRKTPQINSVDLTIEANYEDNNLCISGDKIFCLNKSKSMKIKSNAPVDVIIWLRNGQITKIVIDDFQEKDIEIPSEFSEVWIYYSLRKQLLGRFINNKKINVEEKKCFSDEYLFQQIKERLHEHSVIIPRRFSVIISRIRKYPLCYAALKPVLSKGCIQVSVLNILKYGGFFDE